MKLDPKKVLNSIIEIYLMAKEKKFGFSALLQYTKEKLIAFLKSESVKATLKKIIGTSVKGGFWGFVITYAVEELFEEVAEPIIALAFRKMGYVYSRTKGTILIKKLEKHNREGNERDADIILDNI